MDYNKDNIVRDKAKTWKSFNKLTVYTIIFIAIILKPPSSIILFTDPVKFRLVASGFIIENVFCILFSFQKLIN